MTRRSSKIAALVAALGLALGLGAFGSSAVAQQPPQGDRDPHTLPLGDIQPGRPVPLPQGAGQPGQGRPFPPGGRPGQGFPGQGQGFPGQGQGFPGQRPAQQRPVTHEPEAHASHVCAGHGPLDDPHGFNLWQGILMVNNEAVKWGPADEHGHFHREDSGLSQLLYRYENERDECDPKNQPPPFLASLLNFGLLAFLLYRFGKKPLIEALSARKKAMMQEIDNATRLKTEAEERLSDYEDKLEHLDETLEQMKQDYAAQGETERKHVLAEAEERRIRMKRDVEFRLEQELKAAKALLLAEAVEAAVSAAEEMLRNKVSAADHERSADEYLAGLGAAWKAESTVSNSAGGAA